MYQHTLLHFAFRIEDNEETTMSTIAVTRLFQGGLGKDAEMKPSEAPKAVEPIKKLLTGDHVDCLVVVGNGDPSSKYGEALTDGLTPTLQYLRSELSEHILTGKLVLTVCQNWGLNVGSGSALNHGYQKALQQNPDLDWFMPWSKEFDLDGKQVKKAVEFAKANSVSICGFARKHWQSRLQWRTPQNTACLYKPAVMKMTSGFDSRCDGIEGAEPLQIEVGDVTLSNILVAGMEDFHLQLRALACDPELKIGLVNTLTPAEWATDAIELTDRWWAHVKKVARQESVMAIYVKEILPSMTFEQVIEMYTGQMRFDSKLLVAA
jgi:hypothetical protein